MVSVLTYLKTEQESVVLESIARDLIARISEDYWEIKRISTLEDLQDCLREKPLIHLLIYDICEKESLEFLAEIRKLYPHAHLMVLADVSVSPMKYIRPDLKVSSLLLKPWIKQQACDVLYEFLEEYCEESEGKRGQNNDFHVIETREGIINIPYEQIYFFEAREKKIYVCTGKEEYGFYSSIEKLLGELPSHFARCHRGFIVNTKKIRKIVLSQNIIYLQDGFDVPLSRSYKAALRGMGRNGSE